MSKRTKRSREERRKDALQRQKDRESRSDDEQLDHLIARGHGNCAEAQILRERLGKVSE